MPPLRRLRLDRPIRAAYEGIHAYRQDGRSLVVVCLVTTLAQASRIVAIWASAEAVGIHLSIRPYIVLGPAPLPRDARAVHVNGLGVREAFFVSFLGNLHVGADPAFATGFLFFVMTLALALPGLAVILWEGLRRTPASVPDA